MVRASSLLFCINILRLRGWSLAIFEADLLLALFFLFSSFFPFRLLAFWFALGLYVFLFLFSSIFLILFTLIYLVRAFNAVMQESRTKMVIIPFCFTGRRVRKCLHIPFVMDSFCVLSP